MPAYKNIRPLLRATIVLGSVGAITTAATYATLQSQQAVLAGNTINSATASLLVSTDNLAFNNSKPGFSFSNVVPGGPSVPTTGSLIYLKNNGSSNLALKMAISTVPTNLNGVDLSKVFLHVTRSDNSFDQSFSLKSLIDSYATGGTTIGDNITATTTAQYLLRVSMTNDAFNGTNGITISGIDLVFTGLAS
jgi:hypothetical protein